VAYVAGKPLAGIRVLDFSHVLAGPAATRIFADLGADVLRIESSKRAVTPWRTAFDTKLGRHLAYILINRSKKAMTLDLKSDAGIDIARQLASVVDVVVENFSAGVMNRLGLDYHSLEPLNPHLVYLSMSGYGHDGPRKDWTSMNANLQAYSGLMLLTGSPGEPPVAISSSWMDYIGALHGSFAVLEALIERASSGKGRNIDLAQFESGVGTIGSVLLAGIVNGKIPPRRGNRSASSAPQGCYRCAGEDQWCVLSVENETQWKSLVGVLGNPAWAQGHELQLLAERIRRHDEIDTHIEEWTSHRTPIEIERELRAVGVPAERMRRMDEILNQGNDSVFHVVSGGTDPVLLSGLPFSFQPSEEKTFGPAPRLGEHNESALRDWLNMSESAVSELRAAGVFV
jgi:benzylsuccinate CoA-transferase BbsF subunit